MNKTPSTAWSHGKKSQGKKPPRVIIAAHLPPSVGGITALLVSIITSNLTRDFELVAFNIGRPPKFGVKNNFGYRAILNAGVKRAFLAIWVTLKHLFQFPLVLLKQQPDLVHIHTSPYWVFWETSLYVLACRVLSVPCALQMHFSFRFFYEKSPRFLRFLMLRILRLTSVFVVICKDDIECLKEIGAADIPVFYLPNCIDVKNVQANVRRFSHSRVQNGRLEVLFLGGSEAVRKGLLELLLTIPAFTPRFPELVFRLVAVPAEIVQVMVPKVYQDRCTIEGWVSGEAKFERFAHADIFILPTHAEGMPIAILEAMAAGLPVVASNVGGIPDMITDGKEGLLVPSGDVSALSEAMSKLIESKDLRAEIGNRAFKRAAREYDLSIGIENFRRLYMFLLTGTLN